MAQNEVEERFLRSFVRRDAYAPTWEWQTSLITLRRRMDDILYSPELHCASAQVVRGSASDHFPVEAVFTREVRG
jgi:endonuclease/exonuclease/phosphatase family metal-dependent hydrolase